MNQFSERCSFAVVHAGCRFIQKDEFWLGGQGSGDFQFSLFAVRKFSGQTVRICLKTYKPQEFQRLLAGFLFFLLLGRGVEEAGQKAGLQPVMMTDQNVSSTVMPEKRRMFWKVREIPMLMIW